MKMFYSIRHTFLIIWQIPWPSAVSCGITLSSKSKHPWLISGIDFHSTMIMSCSFGCQELLISILNSSCRMIEEEKIWFFCQQFRLSVNSFSVNSSDCQSTVQIVSQQFFSQQFRLSVNSFSVNSSDYQSTVTIIYSYQLFSFLSFLNIVMFVGASSYFNSCFLLKSTLKYELLVYIVHGCLYTENWYLQKIK